MLVADRESPSVAGLMAECASAMGRPARLLPIPCAVLELAFRMIGRHRDFERLAAPFQLNPVVADRLGWTPRRSFEDELRWTIASMELR
jgi:nucleoside-diphosphate-sugar epimerase